MDYPYLHFPGDLRKKDPLEILFELGGFYECPKDASGKRLGPLVGYAGRYRIADGVIQKQFVGDLYANYAEAEQWPWIYEEWVERLSKRLASLGIDTFMGMPMGGLLVASDLASVMCKRRIYAEKKVTAVATAISRENSTLVFGRHGIREKGERIAICEDVTNNFSTTTDAVKLVEAEGGVVACIITLLNRSQLRAYDAGNGRLIPVIELTFKPMPQYEQDDPAVVEDIAAGKVALKPKAEWPRLMEAMRQHRK